MEAQHSLAAHSALRSPVNPLGSSHRKRLVPVELFLSRRQAGLGRAHRGIRLGDTVQCGRSVVVWDSLVPVNGPEAQKNGETQVLVGLPHKAKLYSTLYAKRVGRGKEHGGLKLPACSRTWQEAIEQALGDLRPYRRATRRKPGRADARPT